MYKATPLWSKSTSRSGFRVKPGMTAREITSTWIPAFAGMTAKGLFSFGVPWRDCIGCEKVRRVDAERGKQSHHMAPIESRRA